MELTEKLLDQSGIGRGRMALRWVSAAEGQIFADTVKELTEGVQALGPFDRGTHALQLAAVERVLRGSRVRWLTGMDRHITESGNVYGDKLDESIYADVTDRALRDEYHKALILETLGTGPRSVTEMSESTGLPLYTVSLRLNDLEKCGMAELKGYEGSTPKFILPAA